jgi:transaldolase
MDPKEARKLLPFKPVDQTSNQRLAFEQMILPENRDMFFTTVRDYKDAGWEAVLNRMVRKNAARIPSAQR